MDSDGDGFVCQAEFEAYACRQFGSSVAPVDASCRATARLRFANEILVKAAESKLSYVNQLNGGNCVKSTYFYHSFWQQDTQYWETFWADAAKDGMLSYSEFTAKRFTQQQFDFYCKTKHEAEWKITVFDFQNGISRHDPRCTSANVGELDPASSSYLGAKTYMRQDITKQATYSFNLTGGGGVGSLPEMSLLDQYKEKIQDDIADNGRANVFNTTAAYTELLGVVVEQYATAAWRLTYGPQLNTSSDSLLRRLQDLWTADDSTELLASAPKRADNYMGKMFGLIKQLDLFIDNAIAKVFDEIRFDTNIEAAVLKKIQNDGTINSMDKLLKYVHSDYMEDESVDSFEKLLNYLVTNNITYKAVCPDGGAYYTVDYVQDLDWNKLATHDGSPLADNCTMHWNIEKEEIGTTESMFKIGLEGYPLMPNSYKSPICCMKHAIDTMFLELDEVRKELEAITSPTAPVGEAVKIRNNVMEMDYHIENKRWRLLFLENQY